MQFSSKMTFEDPMFGPHNFMTNCAVSLKKWRIFNYPLQEKPTNVYNDAALCFLKTRIWICTDCIDFFLNNQPDAPIIQIYSFAKLYIFRGSSLPTIRSFLLYIRHW